MSAPTVGALAVGAAVAVVEDDALVRERVARSLRQAGFTVHTMAGRESLFEHLREGHCDAVVLDLSLPGDDGVDIARALRRISSVPILMLTGRAGVHERIIGLEAGADDYLTKPFAAEELVARVRALLRRAAPAAGASAVDVAVQIGAGRLDLRTRELVGPGASVRLTEREARIVVLLARAHVPLNRATLSLGALGREWDPLDRSLDVHLSKLRTKLREALAQEGVVATIRAEGYQLRVPAQVHTER